MFVAAATEVTDEDLIRAFARETSKLSLIVTSAAVVAVAARKLASWLKSSSCVPVVSKVRLRSESLALGLLDDASTEGRIRGCLTSEAGRSAGDRGVEAFSVSTSVGLNFLPGEEDELMMTGRRKGESRVYGRQVAESVDPTFDGEVEDELVLRNSDDTVDALSGAVCLDGEDRMLLPEALRGDFEGEIGCGILIESNMAARAAFSGDIGLLSRLAVVLR